MTIRVFIKVFHSSKAIKGDKYRNTDRTFSPNQLSLSGHNLILYTLLCTSFCVKWSEFLTLLRRIFGPKRDGVRREWRKLHNEELNDLYCSLNNVRVIKSRRIRWAGHVARMEEGRGVQRVLVGKPEGKRPLGRPRRRWEDNIKMDLQEVGRGCGDWMGLAQDRDRWRALVSTVMNFRVP